MKLAGEADTDAAKLLLMKGAFVLYVKDGNLEKAVETMNKLEKAVTDLPPQSVTNMVETALLGVSKKEDGERLYRLLDGLQKVESSGSRQRAQLNRSSLLGRSRPKQQSVRETGERKKNAEEIDGYTWAYSVKYGEATIESGDMFSRAVAPKPKGHLTIPTTLGGAVVRGVRWGGIPAVRWDDFDINPFVCAIR